MLVIEMILGLPTCMVDMAVNIPVSLFLKFKMINQFFELIRGVR